MTIEDWLTARRRRDDRSAVNATLRLLASGDCPLPVRLGLPGCWRRARGLDDLEDLLDSMLGWPGTRGPDHALVAVAAGRLHPAALATTPFIEPRLLLLAAGQGALWCGDHPTALALLPPAPPRPAALLDEVIACEVDLALEPPALPPRPPPPPPPPPVATTTAASLASRAGNLLDAGRPIEALGLAELGLLTCPSGAPVSVRASLLALTARVRLDLDDTARATERLDALERHLGPSEASALLRYESGALRARWLLEQHRAPEAELLLGQLLAAPDRVQPSHLGLRILQACVPLALPVPDVEQAVGRLVAILREARQPPVDDAAAASASHWLGVWLGRQPGRTAEARRYLLDALDHRSRLGSAHPDRAETLLALAVLQGHQGEFAEAERGASEALTAIEQVAGPWHPLARIAHTCLQSLASARSSAP